MYLLYSIIQTLIGVYIGKKHVEKIEGEEKSSKLLIFVNIVSLCFLLYLDTKGSYKLYLLILLFLLFIIAYIDRSTQKIPTYLIVIFALFSMLVLFDKKYLAHISGSILAILPALIVNLFYKNSIGEGDYYLLLLLGFIVKIENVNFLLISSYFLASFYSICLCLKKKANRYSTIAMAEFFYYGLIITFISRMT